MNPSYLLVLLGVVMVSYSGPLVKGGLLAGANPVTVAALRMLFDILDQAVEEPVSLTLPTRVVRGESVKDLR